MSQDYCKNGKNCLSANGPAQLRSPRTISLGTCSLCLRAGDGGQAASQASQAVQVTAGSARPEPSAVLLMSFDQEEPASDPNTDQDQAAEAPARAKQVHEPRGAAATTFPSSSPPVAAPVGVGGAGDPLEVSRLEGMILRAGLELSVAQMGKHDVQDFRGLSNADYRLGYLLSAMGDAVSMAAVLYRYERQIGEFGFTKADLVRFLRDLHKKEVSPDYERTSVKAIEDKSRVSSRNLLGVQQGPELGGKVRLINTGVSKEALGILLLEGEKDEHGILVPKERLSYLREKLGAKLFVNNAAIDQVAASSPQDMTENPVIARQLEAQKREAALGPKDGSSIVMRVLGETDGVLSLNWNAPFSPNGVSVRGKIKEGGGSWDGSSWCVPLKRVPLLKTNLSLLGFCDASSLPGGEALTDDDLAELAEIERENESGNLYVKFKTQRDGQRLRLFVRKRNQASNDLWEAVKGVGGQWDGSDKTMVIETERLPDLLRILDGNERLHLTSLLPLMEEMNRKKLAKLKEGRERLKQMAEKIPTQTPSGSKIRDYQREGIGFLLSSGLLAEASGAGVGGSNDSLTTVRLSGERRPGLDSLHAHGVILADDMGLGKTLQSIMAAMIKYPQPGDKKLVVCPSSAKINWHKEVAKWLGAEAAARVFIMRGRKAVIPDGAEWVIVNYDIALDNIEALKFFGAKVAILDEAHNLRNFNTRKGQALIGKARSESSFDNRKDGILGPIKDVWALSGTPLMNRIDDLFNLLVAIKHPVAKDKKNFLSRYQNYFSKAPQNVHELGELLGTVMLRRMKSEVLDLPPKVRIAADYEMTAEQAAAYTNALNQAVDKATTDIEVISAMKVFTANSKAPQSIERVREILAGDDKNKILVFSEYLGALDQLEAAFPGMTVRIDGSVSEKKRDEAVVAFQGDPKVKIFLGQMKAAGEALTLTAANHVLINDYPWAPNTLNQAEDRAYRFGQKETVFVHNMTMVGSFDEKLHEVLDQKRELITSIEGRAIAKSSEVNDRASVMSQMLDYVRGELKGARKKKFDQLRDKEGQQRREEIEKMRGKVGAAQKS